MRNIHIHNKNERHVAIEIDEKNYKKSKVRKINL